MKIISTRGEPSWEPPRLVWETDFIDTRGISFDVSADGQRLLVSKPIAEDTRDRIHIVQDWLAAAPQGPTRLTDTR